MEFLDRFSPADRERLLAAGRILRVKQGEYVIRRGERGGDIFFVEEGSFDVVDTRQIPEVVLDTVRAGTVVGEMAFVDAAPRNADVRANSDATLRVWEREALTAVLEAEPQFGRAFWRALAETVTDRFRHIVSSAMTGGIGKQKGAAVNAAVEQQARALAARTGSAWLESDSRLRKTPGDESGRMAVVSTLARLIEDMRSTLSGLGERAEAAAAGELICRELQPFLLRARTGVLSLERHEGPLQIGQLSAHVLRAQAQGDGEFGEVLDQALLDLPSSEGIRSRTELALRTVAANLPAQRPVRLMVVDPGPSLLLARLMPMMSRAGGTVMVLDSSREVLTAVESALRNRPRSVQLRLVQEDVGAMARGLFTSRHELQDFVILDGLVDHLPDRLLASMLGWSATHLAGNGMAVLTGLNASVDAPFYDHILGWPTVRRPTRELRTLIESAGLVGAILAGQERESDPGVVATGRKVSPA